jgi:hypothetical protein
MEDRVRELELWKAGMSVEIDHIKSGVKGALDAISDHAIADKEARQAQRSENRRFLIGVFMLVLAALVGAYFK